MPTALSPLTIVEIPLDKILPNPDNPAGPVQLEEAQAMAESLKAAGQEAEIRVWALTPEEKQAHPGYEYLLLGGHVRLEGAKLAGWSSLRAVVVERTTPEEEFLAATLDNRRRDPGWWRDDLAIERLLKPTQGRGQAKVAAQLGMSAANVNKAWTITQGLNPASRVLVDQNLSPGNVKNKGFLITRRTLLVLADLEDPAIVEKALRVVLDDHLGEGEAKKLVEWVKAGNPAEAYGSQVTPKAAKAEAGTKTPSSPNGAAQAAAPTGTPDFMSQVGSLMAQHELTRKLPIPTTIKDRMFPWVAGLFHKTRGHVQGFGIKNQLFATVLTLLIFLFVGSSLIGWAKRAIRWVVDTAISATYHTTSSPSPLSGQREPNGPAVTMTSPSVSNPPLKEGAGFGDTQGSIPVKAVEKGGVRLLKKSSSKTVKKTNTKASVRAPLQAAQTSGPNTIPSWAQDEIPVAGNFTSRFYGISYSNWADTLGYLKAQVLPNYAPALVAQYFPASLLDKMQKQQLAQYFASSHPPRVVSGQGDSAEILVQGTVTTQTRMGRIPQTVSTKPVALLMSFRHAEGIGSKIDKVTEVDPATVTSEAPNGDLGKSIEGTVQDVSHAVNTAQEENDAVDKAKKILGF